MADRIYRAAVAALLGMIAALGLLIVAGLFVLDDGETWSNEIGFGALIIGMICGAVIGYQSGGKE